MKIVHVLPELQEGGVERHVLWLSKELALKGNDVTVISAGGKLEKVLKKVRHWNLPVHRKNPFSGLYCAFRIALRGKNEGWQILHSHSRVPSWIVWWASCISGIPFVITAHSRYSLNLGIYPLKKADMVVCVSRAVQDHLLNFLPGKHKVIYNGLPDLNILWNSKNKNENKLLFIGRLTRLKGVHVLLKALAGLNYDEWTLDIVGDGPFRKDLENLSRENGLEKKVFFRGFREDTDEWLADCSCFLFPSLEEGMGLTLMRAIQMGVPVLASDIPAVRELSFSNDVLVKADSVSDWSRVLDQFLKSGTSEQRFDVNKISLIQDIVQKVLETYKEIL